MHSVCIVRPTAFVLQSQFVRTSCLQLQLINALHDLKCLSSMHAIWPK